jgi:Leucine-rich repeat (LRR) protein
MIISRVSSASDIPLVRFYVVYNKLYQIPNKIGNLTSLEVLNFNYNMLNDIPRNTRSWWKSTT